MVQNMTTDSLSRDEEDFDADDVNDVADDPNSDSSDKQQTGITLEQLQQQIAEVRNANIAAVRQFSSAVGRLQSTMAKLESGRGDTEKLGKQLKNQLGAVDSALEVVLSDETLAPEVRERARAVRTRASTDSDLAALREEIEALKAPARGSEDGHVPPAHLDFEQSVVEEIESYGLNPDDPAFDWKGAATQTFLAQGEDGTRKYFRSKIRELLAEQATATRRQERKDSANKSPNADGKALRDLDPSRPVEDRLKKLIEMGVIQ